MLGQKVIDGKSTSLCETNFNVVYLGNETYFSKQRYTSRNVIKANPRKNKALTALTAL